MKFQVFNFMQENELKLLIKYMKKSKNKLEFSYEKFNGKKSTFIQNVNSGHKYVNALNLSTWSTE